MKENPASAIAAIRKIHDETSRFHAREILWMMPVKQLGGNVSQLLDL